MSVGKPIRTGEEMARDPGPFECIESFAFAGGFNQTEQLLRSIGRGDMTRAYWLAAAVGDVVHGSVIRAVLKHFELDWTLVEPRAQSSRRGQ